MFSHIKLAKRFATGQTDRLIATCSCTHGIVEFNYRGNTYIATNQNAYTTGTMKEETSAQLPIKMQLWSESHRSAYTQEEEIFGQLKLQPCQNLIRIHEPSWHNGASVSTLQLQLKSHIQQDSCQIEHIANCLQPLYVFQRLIFSLGYNCMKMQVYRGDVKRHDLYIH